MNLCVYDVKQDVLPVILTVETSKILVNFKDDAILYQFVIMLSLWNSFKKFSK